MDLLLCNSTEPPPALVLRARLVVDHPEGVVLALCWLTLATKWMLPAVESARKLQASAVLATCTKKSRGDSRKGVEVRPTSDANPTGTFRQRKDYSLLHTLKKFSVV